MQYEGVRLIGKTMQAWYTAIRLLTMLMMLIMPAAAHSAPKTLLVLGDSLSAEYGLSRGTGWVALLEQRLQQQKIDFTIVNASISGETTIGGKTRLPALLSKHAPTLVIIELGANDALRGLQLSDSKANLQAMIDMAHQAKAKVLLIGMQIPPNYGPDYTQQFTKLFPQIAQQNKVALVPFLLENVADKPALFQADHLHPIEQAQPTLLANVWPQLKPLLK